MRQGWIGAFAAAGILAWTLYAQEQRPDLPAATASGGVAVPVSTAAPDFAAALSAVARSTGAAEVRAPEIFLPENRFHFGKILQGKKVKRSFEFKNVGNEDLVINTLKTTCGCTAAVASTGPYRPGVSGTIDVAFDSRGKVGTTVKDVLILSNDPKSPHKVTMEGVVEFHPQKSTSTAIFHESCAECHAMPAKGKKGKELYDAVCHLCHDFPQETGKNVIAPNAQALATIPKVKLRKLISEGIKESSMPGFAHKAGGPLSDEQIRSLVDYLITIRKKEK